MQMAKTDLEPARQGYALATMDPDQVNELIEANLGGIEFSPMSLPRVTVPAGGATFWTVGDEPVRTLHGIIVHNRLVRRYYSTGLDEGGQKGPPDCASWDCVIGVGDPGGECKTCPLAVFGTAKRGSGQACKMYRMLVMQTPASILQTVVMIPPTSLGDLQTFFVNLIGKGKAAHQVEVALSLEAVEKAGNKTAIVKPSVAGDVDHDFHRDQIMPLVLRYRQMFSNPHTAAVA